MFGKARRSHRTPGFEFGQPVRHRRQIITGLILVSGLVLAVLSPFALLLGYNFILYLRGEHDDFPLGVSIAGIVILAPFVLLFSFACAYDYWFKTRPSAIGLCTGCGYDLRGTRRTPGATCPECGEPVPPLPTARAPDHQTKPDRYLHVGGLIAMGFDPGEQYLLTISTAGRGLFLTSTWERIARDRAPAWPENGNGIGIGPLAGVLIPVTEMDYDTEELILTSPDGLLFLEYESGTITVRDHRPT